MIRYRSHAVEAMLKRQIAPEWAATVLDAPDWTNPDPLDRRIALVRCLHRFPGYAPAGPPERDLRGFRWLPAGLRA